MHEPDSILDTYRDLSPVAAHFLDLATSRPEYLVPLSDKSFDLPEWVLRYSYELQAWPTFVGARKLQEIRSATEQVTRLVKSVPERVFHRDPRKIAAFYGQGNETLVALLLEPPNGIEGALARCDFVDSPQGFKCVEVNVGSFLGGWQVRFWEQAFRTDPHLARFLADEGVAPYFRDPLLAMLRHVIADTRRSVRVEGELNLVILVSPEFEMTGEAGAFFNQTYPALLREADERLTGAIFVCRDPSSLKAQRGQLFQGSRRVHGVLEYTDGLTPEHVYRCFKAGGIGLYNGPISELLADKRSLALLSGLEESDLFSPEERDAIRKHIPWSRNVAHGETTYRGESRELIDLVLARREELVLKPGAGSQGKGVHIGRTTPQDVWDGLVRTAAGEGRWIIQEHVESRPYLFQSGASGYGVHDVVWGTFCAGSSYGGGFLRMMPRGAGDGVINSARGAKRGFYFEV